MATLVFLVVLGLIILAAFMFLKTVHLKDRIVWSIVLAIIGFLALGYWLVLSDKNIDFGSAEGLQTTVKLYFGWFANMFDNVKTLTGEAINMDWKSTKPINNSLLK